MHILLRGEVGITAAGRESPVAVIREGECLGEIAWLTGTPHSVTATARTPLELAMLDRRDLEQLIRLRPDIGLLIYRNLATGLAEKIKRSGVAP
jgi:CRP-like cAMP-binding protein